MTMNNLLIPPSPNWYESRILACSVDNTVVYGSRNEIIVVNPGDDDGNAEIKIFPPGHYGRVLSVDVNQNWAPGHKWIVSAGEDKVIHLWDAETYSLKSSNNAHTAQMEKLIGAVFMGTDKIVSVSENGFISLWRFNTGETTIFKNLFISKTKITTLSACPHVTWMMAFGLHCGLVVIADLRKTGHIIYKLRGHDKSIVSLSWCPAPFNIFPKKENMSKKLSVIQQKEPVKNEESVNQNTDESQQDLAVDDTADGNSQFEESKGSFLEESKLKEIQIENESEQKILELKINPSEYNEKTEIGDSPSELKLENTDDTNNDPSASTTMSCEKHLTEDTKTIEDNLDIETGTQPEENVNEKNLNEDNKIVRSINIDDDETPKIVNPSKEYLLASSARGGSIFIWRAGTDGRKETELHIGGNKNKRWRSAEKTWISLCWITPDILLSSSATAELLQWDLLKVANKGFGSQKKLIHHDHNHNLFAIAAPVLLVKEWKENVNKQELFAWTIGQERYLLCTSLQMDRTVLASYPTIGGNIYTICCSPLDPTRLAIGIGDNTAKIWDLSRPHKRCITMANIWQKIQSKVLALAWHPQKETVLAYGTAEGRIGTVNTSTKNPSLLCQYFRSAVYDIQWGPIEGNPENLGLYAVGEGKLVVYNTTKETESTSDPKFIETPAREHIQCLAWKADFSLLACGTKTGSIIIYDIYLNPVKTIYSEYKSIYCILWHPLATSEDDGTSPMASWLAISSSCTSVVVFDISTEKTTNEEETKIVLNRHNKPVRCISWSPYVGGRIVSGGDDGVIFVWDVQTKTVLATYIEHNLDPVLTVLWSPLEENFVISAGKDNCIRVWNITEHKPKSDGDIKNAQKPYSLFRYERKTLSKEANEDTKDDTVKVQKHTMLNLTSKAQNNSQSLLNDCVRLFNSLNKSELKETEGIHSLINGFDALNIFGDKNSVVELLNTEQKNYEEKKKTYYIQNIELWKGNITEMVKNSITQGNVTPWLISLAPMVSLELWKEACEIYAKKLMEDAKSDPLETVSYLLICHKIEEAIEVLCQAKLFREALALAKCRLSKNDPIITNTLKKWAMSAILTGSYEISAQCFICLGEYEDAAKALFKRTNKDTLKFALTLAEKSGNKDLIDACTFRYNNFKNVGEGDEPLIEESEDKGETKEINGKCDDLLPNTEVPQE